MRRIAHQAALLSISRIANFGLMVISPIVLVRFLTVRDFGRYREFLLYASLLQTIAASSISDSLLYFIPLHPTSRWRVVRATLALTAITSVCVVAVFVVADLLIPGGLVGPYLVPVVFYVLLYVNVDCWETYWVAMGQPIEVFAYTGGRLALRMLVVVGVAIVTNNVYAIIWSLIALEAARLIVATIIWRRVDGAAEEPPVGDIKREQLKFCVPFGVATILGLFSRNLGNVVITKYLGVVALAQLTIGTYADPIITVLRGSISSVILPELVRRLGSESQEDTIKFWHRSILVTCLLLLPAAAIAAWYAEPLITKIFGVNYRPAVPVLRWYSLFVVRCCFDFSPPLRAINRTRPFVTAGVAAALVNGLALAILLPRIGIVGAAIGMVAASLVEAIYTAFCVMRAYRCTIAQLLPWSTVCRVSLCAIMSAVIAFGITYSFRETFAGAICGSLLYVLVFAVSLRLLAIEEATLLLDRMKDFVPALRRRQIG